MRKFLSKFSLLGLIFVFLHAILVVFIPLWVKIFPTSHSCGLFPCIFSDELGLFILFNIPGLFGGSIVMPMLQWLKPEKVRLSGDLTMVDYVPMYLISAIAYYFIGAILEIIFKIVFLNQIYRLKINRINQKRNKS